jgi:RimJ/RimL family protein N-acetyltransferase
MKPTAAPDLVTGRLRLTAHGVGDFDDLHALWSDAGVVRHIGGRPSTAEESWARLLRYRGHWALLDFGMWAVREREGGRFLGDAGLMALRRDIDPPLGEAVEAGWAHCLA